MLRLTITSLLTGLVFMFAGCYDAEHFSVPGPYVDVDKIKDPDTVPYVFHGENLIYLIKDGVPDYSRLSLLGYTDFVPEKRMEEASWDQFTDIYGKNCLRCRQHRNFYAANDKEHFGGNKFSFEFNELVSRVFLENENGKKWRVYAKMALSTLGNNSRAMLSFEGEEGWSKRMGIGLDWNSSMFLTYRNEALLKGWYNPGAQAASARYTMNNLNCYDFIAPGEAFEFELERVDNMFYCCVNGKLVWFKAVPAGTPHLFPLVFRPWMNEVYFYDLCIEGDYKIWTPLCGQNESGYVSVQGPALAVQDNELLLFAEGHRENRMLVPLNEHAVRTNATDIILRRSSDEGESWSDWKVVKGGDGRVYFDPELIQENGRLHLFYSVDVTGYQDGHTRIEHMVSEDGGKNWETPETVAVELEGYEVRTLSGKGVAFEDGTLVLPLSCKIGNRGTVAVACFDGTGWSLGKPVEGLRNESANLVKAADGTLEMYIGYSGAGGSRKFAVSKDHGATWSALEDAGMPTGEGGQMSYGATLETPEGKLLHFTATGNTKATAFSSNDCSVPNEPNEAKARKELYVYNPPVKYMMKGLAFTSRDVGNGWSELEDLWPLGATYKGYAFKTGRMDAAVVGKHVIAVAEGGVMVPYEGLVIFKRDW